MLEKTERANKNAQSRETENTGYTRRRQTQHNTQHRLLKRDPIKNQGKNRRLQREKAASASQSQYALDTTISNQTHLTLIKHGPTYKELEVKTNRT